MPVVAISPFNTDLGSRLIPARRPPTHLLLTSVGAVRSPWEGKIWSAANISSTSSVLQPEQNMNGVNCTVY